jgi:hypothetical protein
MTLRHRTLTVLLSAGLVLAACGGFERSEPAPAAPSTPAPGTPEPMPAPEDPDDLESVARLPIFLVRSGPVAFFVEPVLADLTAAYEEVPSLAGRGPEAREPAALDAATRSELALRALVGLRDPGTVGDPELSTSVPAGTTVGEVRLDGTTLVVDLGGAIIGSSGGSAQETTLVEQLAHTATVDPSITAVQVTFDGQVRTELWGHLDWSEPFQPDPFALSPVTIDRPTHAAVVAPGMVVITGEATVFEATVVVALLDADGRTIREDFVTATTGGPERGTWRWEVRIDAPGRYQVQAGASDPSDGEGPPPYVVLRSFEVG